MAKKKKTPEKSQKLIFDMAGSAIIPDKNNCPEMDFIFRKKFPSFWVAIDGIQVWIRRVNRGLSIEVYPGYPGGADENPIKDLYIGDRYRSRRKHA